MTLREAMPETETGAASRCAGAMLAPFCEAEAAPALVRDLGVEGLARWRQVYPGVIARGSLVVALPRDQGEIARFQRMTTGFEAVGSEPIGALEPELGGRFGRGLFFPSEAHVVPRAAMAFFVSELRRMGADVRFGEGVASPVWQAASAGELVIDARGIAAKGDVPDLRGVRGEMAVIRAPEVRITRPVRLLHPRIPLYVVPWGNDLYMVGATMIEREDFGAATVRSMLELLGAAYALHPGFAEAEVVELKVGVRPAFADNVPGIRVRGRRILVNGAYRHGFLLSPVLARTVADYIETGEAAETGLPIAMET